MSTHTSTTVLSEINGRAGVITLNRPKAMNALNLDMIRQMRRVLDDWAGDDAVDLVIVRGAGERGLCAGGDIATLYRDALEGGGEGATFWKEEYELNHAISTYPKPYVPLMTGIVLGGGIGISAHGSHRVVTDDSRIGMPEVGIGYSPDAGGSHLLSRAPEGLGRHLAYTALHVGAAEAIDTGFADVYVPQERLGALVEKLCETGDAGAVREFARETGPGFGADRPEMAEVYAADRPEMAEVYAADDASEVLARLEASGSEWAAKAAKAMRRNSPLGIRVTEESLNRNLVLDLAGTLTQEFWMSLNMQRHPEFAEGIRAQIIDKDRNPSWEYASLDDVPADVVSAVFEPVDGAVPPSFGNA